MVVSILEITTLHGDNSLEKRKILLCEFYSGIWVFFFEFLLVEKRCAVLTVD